LESTRPPDFMGWLHSGQTRTSLVMRRTLPMISACCRRKDTSPRSSGPISPRHHVVNLINHQNWNLRGGARQNWNPGPGAGQPGAQMVGQVNLSPNAAAAPGRRAARPRGAGRPESWLVSRGRPPGPPQPS
jgi:hypothetical protein